MFAQLAERRARLAAGLCLTDEVLLISAGTPVPLPENSDQTYPFRAHAEFFYATGMECPGAILAFDPREAPEAGWQLFTPEITEDERIWEARETGEGESLATLPAWLSARRGRPLALLGAPLPGVRADDAVTVRVREAFTHARRPKDPWELAIMQCAVAATAAGFAQAAAILVPGVTERAIQIEIETALFAPRLRDDRRRRTEQRRPALRAHAPRRGGGQLCAD